ncbi:MAG: 3-deoxy-manno-octulosonate cytidylyltransferase [Nitrospirae bacterium]|nr:3-deoxy-manno-octulosonate cytidylyltransferase [Nitrospirota bacterium]
MRVVLVIPARYASTRLPAKPLADIAGKPMIQHVWERGRQVKTANDVVVATDDVRIVAVVQGFGGQAVLTSPAHETGTDRLAEVAAGREADVVVNLQGDLPLVSESMIEAVIEPFNDPEVRMATLAREITDPADVYNPNVVKVVMDRDGNALYFSRAAIPHVRDRKDRGLDAPMPGTFYQHFGLYGYRRDVLLEFARWPPGRLEQLEKLEQLRALEHGCPIRVVLTSERTEEVNTPEDLERVRAVIEGRRRAGNQERSGARRETPVSALDSARSAEKTS